MTGSVPLLGEDQPHPAARAVEQSLFPDVAPDRPRGPLVGSVIGGTNADLIAAIAPIYLHGNSVLDVTYGLGGWWKRYRPVGLIAHDRDRTKGDGIDFRKLPEPDRSFDVVCFDPPYVPAGGEGTSTVPEYRERFGLYDGYRSQDQIDDLIRDGLAECVRVASLWVLVKCCDYVNARTFTLGHRKVMDAASDLGLGDPWDLIVHHTGPGPGGHNIFVPKRARRHHSYLLVFEVAP